MYFVIQGTIVYSASLFFYNTGLSTPEKTTPLVIAVHTDRHVDGRINYSHILKNVRIINKLSIGKISLPYYGRKGCHFFILLSVARYSTKGLSLTRMVWLSGLQINLNFLAGSTAL